MKIVCKPIDKLTRDEVAIWSALQLETPALSSPYFRPEYAQAIAGLHDGVEVAILETDGVVVGFWSFERRDGDVAAPVGGGMSDFQGMVIRDGLDWEAQDLLRACGLAAWDFDHLLTSQAPFRRYHRKTAPSPFMDLSGGFESYRASLNGQAINKVLRAGQKLEQEVGPLRLETHTDDRKVFETLVQWKVERYPGMRDNVPLMEAILAQRHESFAGMLTALYAGEQLAAAHFGMRSRTVLHSWVPAYNPAFHKHSPGMILLIEFARQAATLGIDRVDLGKDKGGVALYKSRLMSGSVDVAEGFVARRPLARLARESVFMARELRQSPTIRLPAKRLRDAVYRLLGRQVRGGGAPS